MRGFWVGRASSGSTRCTCSRSAPSIVLWATGIGSLSGMDTDAVTASFADVFMLQSVLWAPTVPNVVWSLAYEMVFYLLLAALFLGGACTAAAAGTPLVFARRGGGARRGPASRVSVLRPARAGRGGRHHRQRWSCSGLVLALAGRGRTRGPRAACLAAATGLLVISFNSGYAAPWESFAIFALMFTGTMLYRRRDRRATRLAPRALFAVILCVRARARGRTSWHASPESAELRGHPAESFNSLEAAGLTFAGGHAVPHAGRCRAPWPGSAWSATPCTCLHPALIEVYASVPWTQNENFCADGTAAGRGVRRGPAGLLRA